MNVSKRKIQFGLVVVMVIGLLFFLHYIKLLTPVENLAVRILKPAQKQLYRASDRINSWYQNRRTKAELEAAVTDLKNQLATSLIEKSEIAALEDENKFLREQLEFPTDDRYSKVISYIIGKSNDDTQNTLIIDQGKKAGIIVGAPVVVNDGILVGKILKVNDYDSVVLLINDHNSRVAVSVQNEDKTIGLIKGEYGLGVKMELIPQIEKIEKSDIVITSGIENNIPRGLIIGTVDSLIGSEEEVFKSAVIKLPVDFNKLFAVNVLVNKNP
jgi:rod shape-determining protein MreC